MQREPNAGNSAGGRRWTRTLAALAGVAALGVGAFAFSACEDDISEADAVAAFCEDQQAYNTAAANLEAIEQDGSATVAQLEAAYEQYYDSYAELVNSAEDYLSTQDEELGALGDSLDSLEDAIGEIDESQTIDQVKADLQDERDAVVAAKDEVTASVTCA
jgi:hypothetical protein